MTQNDNNNPYGSFLKAQIELDRRIANALHIKDKQLSWDSGFLGWSECIQNDPDTGECTKRGPTKTPGKIIEGQLAETLGSGIRQLELADEFDELVSALFTQLVKQIFSSGQGLFNGTGFGGSTSSSSGSGVIYNTINIYKYGTGLGTITSIPTGINCGATCGASFSNTTSVTLVATPEIGSRFSSWFGGVCVNATSTTCVIPMTTTRNITAIFEK
jgi:hypothetical protein